MLGNLTAAWALEKLLPALFDGMGGVNVQGIEAGLRLLQLPESLRENIFQKLLLLAATLREKEADGG